MKPWWFGLAERRRKVWSQLGEEGVIDAIFQAIGETNRFAVDIGAGDGFNLSNVRGLIERGWQAFLVDGRDPPSDGVTMAMVTIDNVNDLMSAAGVPAEPDFMSLDLDGVDWWIWKAIERRPRVVVVEFNGAIPNGQAITVPYDPAFRHDGTTWYGASFDAFVKLGRAKGYEPVCQMDSQNLFFVRRDAMPPGPLPDVTYAPVCYHPPSGPFVTWVKV